MASAKIATLVIRTLAKPISSRIKLQVREHERFRGFCIDLAQWLYRSEVKLRTNVLGEPAARNIRPLSEAKAIENGANFLAESFLFTVASALIIGETFRSSRNQSKRRDSVDDQLEDLGTRLAEAETRVNDLLNVVKEVEEDGRREKERNDELARILERVVEFGLRGGWVEFQDGPVQIPRVSLTAGIRTVAGASTSEEISTSRLTDASSSTTPAASTPARVSSKSET